MAEEKKAESNTRDWSTRAGLVKEGSIEKTEKGLRAIVVNGEGKESIVEAYGEKNEAKLNAAAEGGKPYVFRGPVYFKDKVPHLLINHTVEQGAPKEPKPELTAEEKAARAEQRKLDQQKMDETRVPVAVGSVEAGGTISVNGNDVTVSKLGREFEVTETGAASLKDRFGVEFEVGSKVAYASFEAEPEDTPSPM